MARLALAYAIALAAALAPVALAAHETVPAAAPPGPVPTNTFAGEVALSFGYNDNVLFGADQSVFLPPGAERGSTYGRLDFGGVYEWEGQAGFNFGILFSAAYVAYFDTQEPGTPPFVDDPADYSQALASLTLYGRATPDFAGGRLELLPSYTFRIEGDADVEALGVTSHQLRFDARYQLSQQMRLDGHVLFQRNDHSVVFALPQRNRDADYAEAGVSLVHEVEPNGRTLHAGIAFEHNDAEGSDWDFDGIRVSAGISGPLSRALRGSLDISVSDRDTGRGFTDIIAVGRTDMTVTTIRGELSYRLSDRGRIRASLTYENVNANDPGFSGSSTAGEIGYVYRF